MYFADRYEQNRGNNLFEIVHSQCAPGSFNLNQKVHGLYDFYKTIIYKTIQNQLKKPSVIGLQKQ